MANYYALTQNSPPASISISDPNAGGPVNPLVFVSPVAVEANDTTVLLQTDVANLVETVTALQATLQALQDSITAAGPVQYNQTGPSSSWIIANPLGYLPDVTVYINDEEVEADVDVSSDTTTVTITFSSPQVGYALLR